MSLLSVLEGQTGGTAAAVLREEVLHKGKHTVEFSKRHAVQKGEKERARAREREREYVCLLVCGDTDLLLLSCQELHVKLLV